MVALLPVAWVVVTPFAAAALIAGSARAHRLVAGHLTALVALGWLGVAMLAAAPSRPADRHGPCCWLSARRSPA